MIDPTAIAAARTHLTDEQIADAEQRADRESIVAQMPIDPTDARDTWMKYAACSDADPELFHPTSDVDLDRIDEAEAICIGCPVHAACRLRRYETGAVGVVMGGVYYPISARGKRPCVFKGCTAPAKHQNPYCGFDHEHAVKSGTSAGYELHRRNDNTPCKPCAEAGYRAGLKYDHRHRSDGAVGARRPRGVRQSGSRIAT